jgi:ATP-dependent exoDNAse (exonuclease V) beta subunit
MSPLAAVLRTRFGADWWQVWEGLSGLASQAGFAGMVERIVDDCWAEWSDFGRRRAGDVIMALAGLDARGGATPQEAADWIERLEVSQSPGSAAVQVMTIHKSKGLGFDVVVLPDVPNDSIPSAQYFEVAETGDWITQTPPKWARDLIPEMREAEAAWAAAQRYEAFCMLYVALTRSKRGLYVLLEPPAASQDTDKPSLANWLATSVSSDGRTGIVYQSGSPDWVETLPREPRSKVDSTLPPLAAGVARRERATPSGLKKERETAQPRSASGREFGSGVHAAFEQVGWMDEASPTLSAGRAGDLVASLVEHPKIRPLFVRNGRRVDLFREQAVEAIVDGKWLSGVIDRLHLHRDPAGGVTCVEVIDFKTDALDDIHRLAARYSSQMEAYRTVMALAYPGAEIRCILLSTRCREWVVV